ncbi:cation:dicarboxylase symporter family transporter, partial [Clostridium sp. IBUN13A]
GMITLAMVLQSANLPLAGIALIIGFDRILDMMRTTVNVMGDCVCSVIVAKSEDELDEKKYSDYVA